MMFKTISIDDIKGEAYFFFLPTFHLKYYIFK